MLLTFTLVVASGREFADPSTTAAARVENEPCPGRSSADLDATVVLESWSSPPPHPASERAKTTALNRSKVCCFIDMSNQSGLVAKGNLPHDIDPT